MRETWTTTETRYPAILSRRFSAVLRCVCAVAILSSVLGCHSFQPLRKHTNQQVTLARQWTKGGLEALQNGSLNQAKSCFSRAVEHDPNDQYVHANLARAVARQGDTNLAIDHMRRAVELSCNDPKLVVELGELYLQAGQWLPAKRAADLALEKNHRFAPAWALQAKTSRAKGNLDQALSEFQRSAGIDSQNVEVQMAIVEIYQEMKQPLRALSAVEQLLSQFPPDQQPEPALVAKGVALMELKQLSPAIELLQTASQRDDATSEVYLRLGQAQLLAGQVSQARLTLSQAKIAFPQQQAFDELLTKLQSGQQPHVAAVESRALR